MRPYSGGIWVAKPGREAEFARVWQEFTDWSLVAMGSKGWAKSRGANGTHASLAAAVAKRSAESLGVSRSQLV